MDARGAAARDNDSGFTLIELMVVVLIIAILLAIAIPTFLGAQNKSKDRAAQSSVRNAHTAAKTIYADETDYAGTDETTLAAVGPSLSFAATGAESTGPKHVSVSGSGQTFVAAAVSDAGDCFGITDVSGVVTYAKFRPAALEQCDATTASGKATLTEW